MHIILAVTNDIRTDRRIIRTAHTLHNLGAHITIIGRRLGRTYENADPRFHARRMRLMFNRGPLFYAEYNLRLFLRLMVMKSDILVSNDLDTLPAVFLASRIRHKTLVYDSHEYFTEVPELIGRKRVKRVWEWLESRMLPRIRYAYTVSLPIARAYEKKYGINMAVIRNLPFKRDPLAVTARQLRTGKEKVILYQGSLNMGRGLELAIRAVPFTRNARLVIIGTGDVEKELKELALSLQILDRVSFAGRISPEQLFGYTMQADLGISLEEDLGLNYKFSLPNKVFDYIQAGVPVLVSDLPEVRALVERYEVGVIMNTRNAKDLGTLIVSILENDEQMRTWKANLKIAAAELCWENEEQEVINLFQRAFRKS